MAVVFIFYLIFSESSSMLTRKWFQTKKCPNEAGVYKPLKCSTAFFFFNLKSSSTCPQNIEHVFLWKPLCLSVSPLLVLVERFFFYLAFERFVVHRCYQIWRKWPIFVVFCSGVMCVMALGHEFRFRRRKKSSLLIGNFVCGKYN